MPCASPDSTSCPSQVRLTNGASRKPHQACARAQVRFMLGSFYFNIAAMAEQVATSFGLNMQAWLDGQVSAL